MTDQSNATLQSLKSEKPWIERQLQKYTKIVLFAFAGILVLVEAWLFLQLHASMFTFPPDSRWALFVAILFYLIVSFRMVPEDRVGAILFFGRPLAEIQSGPVFLPLFLFSMRTDPRLIVQLELPADPERIYHGKEPVAPAGLFPPIRVPFADASTAASGKCTGNQEDPLDARRLTAEIVPVVEVQIQEGQYIDFIRNIGDFDQLRQQLTDTVVGSAYQELTQMTVAYALKNMKDISTAISDAVEAITDKVTQNGTTTWGAKIIRAYLKQINFHAELNQAIARPAEEDFKAKAAEGEKRATVVRAEGTARATELTGGAEAQVIRLKLEKEGEGLKALANAIDAEKSGEMVLSAQVAKALGTSGNVVVVGAEGARDLFGLAAGMAATAKKQSAATPSNNS